MCKRIRIVPWARKLEAERSLPHALIQFMGPLMTIILVKRSRNVQRSEIQVQGFVLKRPLGFGIYTKGKTYVDEANEALVFEVAYTSLNDQQMDS
jgi:hypothetical protein